MRFVLAALLCLFATPSVAGPPYFTDDPAPTELGHWEIYAFGAGTKTPGVFEGATGFDLNYGPVEDVQLTATLPVDFLHDDGTHVGFGDIELGVKYRFINHEDAGFAMAIFPRVILPTARARFGTGKVRVLLPVWAQQDFGGWSLFGGGGYTINPGAGNRDFWQSGVALTRTLSETVSLGGELFWQGAEEVGGHSYAALNFGGSYKLSEHYALLFSGGPGIRHGREGGRYNVYAALAMNF